MLSALESTLYQHLEPSTQGMVKCELCLGHWVSVMDRDEVTVQILENSDWKSQFLTGSCKAPKGRMMNTAAKIELLQPALHHFGFCWLELRLCKGQDSLLAYYYIWQQTQLLNDSSCNAALKIQSV